MKQLRFIKNLFWVFLISLIVNACCALFDGNPVLNWYEWLLGLFIMVGFDFGIIYYTEETFWTMKDIINKIKQR